MVTADTISARKLVQVRDARTGKILYEVPAIHTELKELSFSPCGRLLALGADLTKVGSEPKPGLVRFWDTAVRRECGRITVPWGLHDMAFSPTDALLAVSEDRHGNGPEQYVGLYRVLPPPPLARPAPERPYTANARLALPAAAERWWAELAGDDAEKAYSVVLTLSTRPAVAVALLGRKLRPAPAPDRRRIEALAADLASDQFAARQRASIELAKLAEFAEPALRRAAEGPDAEARRRARRLLGHLDIPIRDPQRLRAIRSAEVLELVATEEARRLLGWLAGGAPEATLTREAAASLARLQRRKALEGRR